MLPSITRYSGGVGNQSSDGLLADLRVPFVGSYYQFFNDFNAYVAGDWTLTGTGSAALATGAAAENGVLNIISSAGGEQALQLGAPPALTFGMNATKEMFFATRIALDDGALGGFFIGLSALDGTPYASAPTDGIFMRKTAGANGITATLRSGSVDIATALFSVTMANNTFVEAGFAYTPGDGVLRAFCAGGGARLSPITMPVGGLSPNISSFGAAARTLSVDYVYVAKSR